MSARFRPFGYWRDPLFLFSVVLYAVNRFAIKPNCTAIFFHAWLNDVICIPFTLPPMLWVLKLLRLRFREGPPTFTEIALPLVVISWAFEIYLPNTERFHEVTVADPWDIVAYTSGAVVSGFFWYYWYRNEPFLPAIASCPDGDKV